MAAAIRPVRAAGPIPRHRVLRDMLRHYIEFRDLVNSGGNHVLTHSYLVPDGEGVRKETIAISFWDLHRGINELAPRKREALYWNVIRDEKQKDVAARMGITTVSVGQYVEAATRQLAAHHWPDSEEYATKKQVEDD
jgi:DNA-directed RNA polymerase specialized sigma24 family protein